MGIVIYLPERVDADAAREPRKLGPAQILFFTGVRYERHPDGPDAQGRASDRPVADAPRPRRRRRG